MLCMHGVLRIDLSGMRVSGPDTPVWALTGQFENINNRNDNNINNHSGNRWVKQEYPEQGLVLEAKFV